jgi:hypothetical protein
MSNVLDPRPEGLYCSWESYPRNTFGMSDNILVIERVDGDGTMTRFECARSETHVIFAFLADK